MSWDCFGKSDGRAYTGDAGAKPPKKNTVRSAELSEREGFQRAKPFEIPPV
jgi:hypothetical protein